MRNASFCFAIGWAIVVSTFCGAGAATIGHHSSSVLALGATFDPIDLTKKMGPCIEFEREISLDRPKVQGRYLDVGEVKDAFAGETRFDIDVLTSKRDFYRYMRLSASVSGHYAMFSGGGSFDLEEEDTYSSDSFSFIVRALSDYGRFGMEQARLNAEAKALLGDLAAFRNRCGLEFVAQVNRSVLAAVVYRIKNLSQSSKRRMEASFNVSAGGGIWGVDAGATFKSFVSEAIKEGTLELKIYLVGGAGVRSIAEVALDPSNIEDVKRKLVEYVKGMGADRAMATQYATGPLSVFVPKLANIDFDGYLKSLDEFFFLYSEIRSRRRRVMEFLLNYSDFVGSPAGEFERWKKLSAALGGAQENVQVQAAYCRWLYDGLASIATQCRSGTPTRTIASNLEIVSRLGRSASKGEASAFGVGSPLMTQMSSPRERCASSAPGKIQAALGAVCNVDHGWMKEELSRLPPAYPFEVQFTLVDRPDAAGRMLRELGVIIEGGAIQRAYFEDKAGALLQIAESRVSGSTRVITAALDVTDYAAAGRLPLNLRVEMRSGREYARDLPIK